MILELVETYVDEDDASTNMWDVELTDEELKQIERWAEHGWSEEDDEVDDEGYVTFRDKEYGPSCTVVDILNDAGKRIGADHTINVYHY